MRRRLGSARASEYCIVRSHVTFRSHDIEWAHSRQEEGVQTHARASWLVPVPLGQGEPDACSDECSPPSLPGAARTATVRVWAKLIHGLPRSALFLGLGTVLLCGCGAAAQSSSEASPREPDCSFRSGGTCWTVAARFPESRADATDSLPAEPPSEPRPLLAIGADEAFFTVADRAIPLHRPEAVLQRLRSHVCHR